MGDGTTCAWTTTCPCLRWHVQTASSMFVSLVRPSIFFQCIAIEHQTHFPTGMRPSLGLHITDITDLHQVMDFLQNIYVGQILYTLSITSIKLSVLAFYWRLFEIKARFTIIVVTACSVAWCIAIVSRRLNTGYHNTLTGDCVLRCFASSSTASLSTPHGTLPSLAQNAYPFVPFTSEALSQMSLSTCSSLCYLSRMSGVCTRRWLSASS